MSWCFDDTGNATTGESLGLRKLLRIQQEYIQWLEESGPDWLSSLPILTHSPRGERLSDAFGDIEREICRLRHFEEASTAQVREDISRELDHSRATAAAIEAKIASLRLAPSGEV